MSGQEMSMGLTTRQVSIVLSKVDGVVNVTPHSVPVHVGDTVEWSCGEEAWTIEFPDLTPLSSSVFHGVGARGGLADSVRSDAGPGHYKYTVAVYDGEENMIHLLDPDVWVQ